MDFRELPAPLPQHYQQTPPYIHQQPQHIHQLPPHMHQQPPPQQALLMQSQLTSHTPQLLSNNNNANNNSDTIQHQNPSFQFNSVPQKPLDSHNSQFTDVSSPPSGFRTTGFSTESAKKKRGRPRKYSPDGNIALGLSSSPVLPVQGSEQSSKKGRGRPAGSGKKQMDALGFTGVGFTPHVIIVGVGEDISSKIMAFSQQGPRTVCILSANGAIRNVTLRQTSMSSSTVSYEGGFEIISLSGSFSLSDNSGSLNRIGSLTVSLAGPEGQVLGGVVAGALMAATPVQVIVGSFVADGKKLKSGVSPTPPPSMLNFGVEAPGVSPPLKGGSSESSDASGSTQLNRTTGPNGSASEPITPMFSNMAWANSTMNMLPN